MTTITAACSLGGTMATVSGPQPSAHEVIQDLVVPALIGIGFHPDAVWEAIAELGAEYDRSRDADSQLEHP